MTIADTGPAPHIIPITDDDGRLPIGFMPVAADGVSDATKLVRSDDTRLAGGGGGSGGDWSHQDDHPDPVSLANGAEVTITHPAVDVHGIIVSILEAIDTTGTKVTPTMASNSQSGFIASASADFDSGYPAWRAFNGTTSGSSDAWLASGVAVYASPGTWQWLRIDLPSAATVVSYSLTSRNLSPGDEPKQWVIQGSNDSGSTWTDLDTRNVTFTAGAWSGTIASPGSYTSYRILVKESVAGAYVSIGEWSLYEAGETHYECCTLGSYASSAQFGVRHVSPTETKVKNLSGTTKSVFVNVLTEPTA